jgi:hypothetical protein
MHDLGSFTDKYNNILLTLLRLNRLVSPQDTADRFAGGKAAEAWSWPHVHLVSRSRMMELYFRSPIYFHIVVRN